MKKKSSAQHPSSNLPVSKQTAGGVAGASVGGVIAGPVGAVAGAIAGTMMGNRAAKGKTLVSSGTVKTAAKAVKTVKDKLPTTKKSVGSVSKSRRTQRTAPKTASAQSAGRTRARAGTKAKAVARRK
jgi:uncharacterized protein YcfJ